MIYMARVLTWILLVGVINAFNLTSMLKNVGQRMFDTNFPQGAYSRSLESVVNDAIKSSEEERNISQSVCAMTNENGSERPIRIVLTSSIKYLPGLINWFAFYREVCGTFENVYLVCLDNEIELELPRFGLYCSKIVEIDHDRSNIRHASLWLARTRIVESLLRQNYDILLSDSDAIWLQNPFPYLSQFNTSDIISSRASFPKDASRRWGAALCMGFIYIKSTHTTVKFWGDVSQALSKWQTPDDQQVVNDFLIKNKLSFPSYLKYNLSETADTGLFSNRVYNGSVTLLPDTLFRRICMGYSYEDVSRSIIAHCLTVKQNLRKIMLEKQYGLWVIRSSWNSSNVYYHSFHHYLDNVVDVNVVSNLILRNISRYGSNRSVVVLARDEGYNYTATANVIRGSEAAAGAESLYDARRTEDGNSTTLSTLLNNGTTLSNETLSKAVDDFVLSAFDTHGYSDVTRAPRGNKGVTLPDAFTPAEEEDIKAHFAELIKHMTHKHEDVKSRLTSALHLWSNRNNPRSRTSSSGGGGSSTSSPRSSSSSTRTAKIYYRNGTSAEAQAKSLIRTRPKGILANSPKRATKTVLQLKDV